MSELITSTCRGGHKRLSRKERPLAMKVNVLFFGAAAEAAGGRSVEITVDPDTTARQVFDRVLAEKPALAGKKLLFALNQEYTRGDATVSEGDELAVFTAVSGG